VNRPAGESVFIAHTEIDERREGEGLGSPEYVDIVDASLRNRFASSS
jgi:hypothetical protein